MQLVQQVDLNTASVAAFAAERVGPVETVGLEQHPARLLDRGPHAEAGHAHHRFGIGREAVHLHDEDAHGRRALVGKVHIERAKAELAPEFAPVHHMAADAVGPTEQGSRARHIAGGQRIAHGRTRHPQAMHLVAAHARHVEAQASRLRLAGRIEHGVVAGTLGAKAEVIAHQHIARMEPPNEHVVDEGLRGERGKAVVEGHHDGLIDAASGQFAKLVAQRRDACRGAVVSTAAAGEVIARMRLESQHATGQTTVLGLVAQQGQHGLVTAVHAIEVAYRQRALGCNASVVEPSEKTHAAQALACTGGVTSAGPLSQRHWPGARSSGSVSAP